MFEPENFIQKQVQEVREIIGDEKVVIAASGGVDSTVCAVLTHRAVEDRAVTVFIDDGLMREGEAEQVINFFKARFKLFILRIRRQKQEYFTVTACSASSSTQKRPPPLFPALHRDSLLFSPMHR